MENILTLTFKTAGEKESTITINGVREDLTAEEINSLMDTILSADIFSTKSGSLTEKASAKITQRKVTSIELA